MDSGSSAGRSASTTTPGRPSRMTTWRWVFVGVGLAAFTVVAVLIATHNASASQVADGFWFVVVVGALAQLVLANRKRSTPAQAPPPDAQGPGEVDDTTGPAESNDRS